MRAYVKAEDGCAVPGDVLKLSSAAVVKARCQGSCTSYATWPITDATVATTIQVPILAAVPEVSISIPATLGTCSPLLLDVASSGGSGERPWASQNITVKGVSLGQDPLNNTLLIQLQDYA